MRTSANPEGMDAVEMAGRWRLRGSVERLVDADAEEVYARITDVASVGERSSECRHAAWLPSGSRWRPGMDPTPATAEQSPVVGARFRGSNRAGWARWSRVCEVVEADAGRRFAFRTVPERFDPSRADSTTWRYELVPQATGTLVRHSYEITRPPAPLFRAVFGRLFPHHMDMRPAMGHTLDRLAETTAPAAPGS